MSKWQMVLFDIFNLRFDPSHVFRVTRRMFTSLRKKNSQSMSVRVVAPKVCALRLQMCVSCANIFCCNDLHCSYKAGASALEL